MQILWSLSKINIIAFCSFLAYTASIALGSIRYLPYQTSAPGVFKSYSINGMEYAALVIIALISTMLIPKKIERPSDWFLIIFVVMLLVPGLTLGIASKEMTFERKLIILPTLIASMVLLSMSGRIRLIAVRANNCCNVKKGILCVAIIGWVVLFSILIAKYHDVMKFSTLNSIYDQRELTGAVGSFWGYAQLYFNFVCSTLLIAYGLSNKKLFWVAIGNAGYVTMYLITAEKSQLLFPVFFILVNYFVTTTRNHLNLISGSIVVISTLTTLAVYFSEHSAVLDFAGFYLFTRLIATPSQFILDYYDFFSTNGYTYFSQIKGFNLLFEPPVIYASDPKWPQLGWIVGSAVHGIESNSNATFLASDGAASLGATGVLIVTFLISCYFVIINHLYYKFPKPFWSIIFAQQAFILVSGSLFTLMVSFGGFFYLLLFSIYKPKTFTDRNRL